MSARSIQINIKINFPAIVIAVLIFHALTLNVKQLDSLMEGFAGNSKEGRPAPIRIVNLPDSPKRIRTVGSPESKIKDSAYLQKTDGQTKTINKEKVAQMKGDARPLSLKDLTAAADKTPQQVQPVPQPKSENVRPGARPEIQRPKALTAIGLRGSEIKKFLQNDSSGTGPGAGEISSGGEMAASLSNSDVSVNLEVPEGVSPDELNKYELMFYGFQRRTAINYVNSFYKNLGDFQRANPHLEFPMTQSKQVMTGRLTYDAKGNIKQIKMIRWSNEDRLQNFFLDVLKDMDTLHNPPTALWEKNGEFSIFFSLVVNG